MSMAATAWGFTGTNDRDWVRQSACLGNWAAFDVAGKELSADNTAALALCATCPVRVECRDDYLGADRQPAGIIAGGWWWDYNGRPHPHPGDLTPVMASGRVNGWVYAARKAVTAARAIASDGITYEQAAEAHGAAPRSVKQAAYVFRHAPDLCDAVWEGARSLAAAHAEAITRRHQAVV